MKTFLKSAMRMFSKQFTRLLTIMAIVVVSIGFMSGIGEVEEKIKEATANYYVSQNISDLYLKSTNAYGFSSEELTQLENKFGAENILKSFSYETKIENDVIRVYYFDFNNININKFELVSGSYAQTANTVVVERETSAINGYNLGEVITLNNVFTNQPQELVVTGTVLNPLIINQVEEPSFQFENEHLSNIVYINQANLPIINDVYVSLTNKNIFNAFSSSYEKTINALKAEVKTLLGEQNVSVLSLYENFGIYSMVEYAEKVGLIGIVFVVFFLLVTLLVVYSTMSRLLDEERGQIATLKTLGYSDIRIVVKYLIFVAVATLVGGLLALGVGVGLTQIIYNAFNLQYAMPPFPSGAGFIYYLITFAIILVSTILLTLFTGLKLVKNKPVTLLTPKAPKSGKKVFLEHIPFIWNKLSFKYKSTIRNVFLFKSRFFMTVTSIIGSTVLVFAGMGLMDCATKIEGGSSLITISLALIIFSALLCALVIYNLTNINVSERNREIATLMVLGYHNKEVTGYIFREIYIMSFIGGIIGVPLGYVFIDFVFNLINFGAVSDVNWWTYILAPMLTMVFSFLSTMLLYKKITKTDMNASLKTLE